MKETTGRHYVKKGKGIDTNVGTGFTTVLHYVSSNEKSVFFFKPNFIKLKMQSRILEINIALLPLWSFSLKQWH